MNTFNDIFDAFCRQVELPWANDISPAERVWLVWYDKSLERRFVGRISEFEHATLRAGHGWQQLNLSQWFGNWIAQHEFFDGLVHQPKELRGLLPDLEDAVIDEIKQALQRCSENDVLAVAGCGSLFGVARVSTLISRVASSVPGRIVFGFPGKHSGGVYRLLDARDGWNYHATPIPPDRSL